MPAPDDTYPQSLRFGSIRLERADPESAPYMLSGRKMYVLGTVDGAFRPIGAEHLRGEMGGVWAHPVRFADGWHVTVHDSIGAARLDRARVFEGHLSDVEFHFDHGPLRVVRTDFVAEDDAAFFGLLEVRNSDGKAWRGQLGIKARIRFRPTWFGGWETGTTLLRNEHGVVVGYDDHWQGRWGLAFGGTGAADEVIFGEETGLTTAELRYDVELAPDETRRWEFLLTADHQGGHAGALQLWGRLTGQGSILLAAKRDLYLRIAKGGVILEAPDVATVQEYELAKVNVHLLTADYGPYLPGYFLAGVPEYPQLFGCDSAYSIAGATAAGFESGARSTLGILGEYARRASGRTPHEITTNGRVFHPGNTQETPQFALAVWDYVRWTGDLPFLRLMYPICREGVMEYLPSMWDFDRDGYPLGDAMVERTGMGSLKLDSACYLYAAWQALAEMAAALGRPEADEYRLRAADWHARFERDWWLPEEQLYADSLHSDLRPQLDGHWTQVVPVQLGISPPDHARHVLAEIERSFVNEYGLVHTRGREDRVWTLPTGLLALAQFRWGQFDQAIKQLHNIALTTRHGMLGSFEELIPEGLCFVQLWSAALYLQGIVEGVLGLDPRAHEHRLRLHPRVSAAWPSATLRNVRIGQHTLTLEVSRAATTITHDRGPEPLMVEHQVESSYATRINDHGAAAPLATVQAAGHSHAIVCRLDPGRRVSLTFSDDGVVQVEYTDPREIRRPF